jgi:apolipoprotein N-acyltransferase
MKSVGNLTEFVRTHLFSGFPWNLHGYALVERASLARLAAGSGVYGCSFLLVAVNALVALAILRPHRARVLGVVIVALVLAILGWREPPRTEGTTRAVLVQTNIPVQTEYPADWMERNRAVLDQLDGITAAAAQAGPRPALVVWPETPAPFYFHQDPRFRARMMVLAQGARGNLVVGVVDYRRDPAGREAPYNSAVVLTPGGGVVAQYDKIHLVPFGEYVPARRLLWFARKLTAEVGDFAPGDAPTVARTESGPVGVFICYEAIFPALVREFTARGAEVLVNISNDGWFGRSAAPEQHLWMARMRAIENGRWLLRATNNGITCVIDPQGRVRARLSTDVRATLDAQFAFRRGETPYVRYGDWMAWLSVVFVVAALFRQYWIEQTEVPET